MVDDVGHEVSKSDVGAEEERRWPAWVALFTAGWVPGITSRRTEHVGLLSAFGVHLLSALLLGFVVVWLARCNEGLGTVELLDWLVGEIWMAYVRDPGVTVLALLLGVVGVEVGVVMLAILVTPWGAQDEPMMASVKSALRWTWLHSSHAAVVVLLIGAVEVPLSRTCLELFTQQFADRPQLYPDRPSMPVTTDRSSPEWQEYAKALQIYDEAMLARLAVRDEWRQKCPWVVAHAMDISNVVNVAAGTWWICTLLYGAGARHRVRSLDRPPLCGRCGYNLTQAREEGQCPECGEAVSASVGPECRRGTAWERREAGGMWRAWWRTGMDAILYPAELGRQLRVLRPSNAHRRYLLMHLVLVFVLMCLWGSLAVYLALVKNPSLPLSEMVLEVGLVYGCVASMGLLAFSLLLALVVGLWFRRSSGRNLLPATMQAVSYMGLYMIIWAIAEYLIGWLMLVHAPWKVWDVITYTMGLNDGVFDFMLWFVPNLLLAVVFVTNVCRITSGARWANS